VSPGRTSSVVEFLPAQGSCEATLHTHTRMPCSSTTVSGPVPACM
jgi:hypothetical protein